MLPERRQRSWPHVQLHLPLPPDQQGVIPAPAPLTCLINPCGFPILTPLGGARGTTSSLIWFGIQRHSNLSPAGGASLVRLREKTYNGMKGRGGGRLANDDDAPEKMTFTDWAGSLGWVEMGRGYRRRRGKITFSTILSGGLFSLKQDRACWTLFLLMIQPLSFLLHCFLFCFYFDVLFLSPTVNPETIPAWSGEFSPCMFCYLRNIPFCRNAVRSKWWRVVCKVC